MATNEPTLLGMLLQPKLTSAINTQARANANRDAQLFSANLNTAQHAQRHARPEPPARQAAKPEVPERSDVAAAVNRQRAPAHAHSNTHPPESSANTEHLNKRQKETLARLEPAQREAVEALPPEQQAVVLDEWAQSPDFSPESLEALLAPMGPAAREQLQALLDSLTEQLNAGEGAQALVDHINQAAESGQIPPELAALLSDQLQSAQQQRLNHTAGSTEALAGRLSEWRESLHQALPGNNVHVAAAAIKSGPKGSELAGLVGSESALGSGGVSDKNSLISLNVQREQGALVNSTNLHNLMTPRAESGERSTAGSITALTESLGMMARNPVTQAASPAARAAGQMLPHFNNSGWGDSVGQKVLWMAKQNITSADMRLDPPDLGSIHVRVSVQNDQAHVTFTSPQALVRDALDQNSARLRDMLAEQGLADVDVDVSDERSFAQSDPETGAEQGQGGARAWGDNDSNASPDQTPSDPVVSASGVVSLVDHYA
jgi:flagellar hook-length control protein FliK